MTGAFDPRLAPFIDAAFDVIAKKGWQSFSLEDLDTMDLPSGEHLPPWRDKQDVLTDFGAMIDAKVAADIGDSDKSLSARERLFDVLMARFDALTPYRDAIDIIARASLVDPRLSVFFAFALPRSMRRMLSLAHIRVSGIEGALKARVLSALWLNISRIWLRDDSPDLGKTMAALDRALARIEPVGERLFPHDRGDLP